MSRTVLSAIFAAFFTACLWSVSVIAESVSPKAKAVWEKWSRSCADACVEGFTGAYEAFPKEKEDQVDWTRSCAFHDNRSYEKVTISKDMIAEIIEINCYGHCGSAGCTSYVIVKDRVYRTLGSKPFVMRGNGQSAIVWFGGGGECNDNSNVEDCLFAMYWSEDSAPYGTGKLMYYHADDVTEEYE